MRVSEPEGPKGPQRVLQLLLPCPVRSWGCTRPRYMKRTSVKKSLVGLWCSKGYTQQEHLPSSWNMSETCWRLYRHTRNKYLSPLLGNPKKDLSFYLKTTLYTPRSAVNSLMLCPYLEWSQSWNGACHRLCTDLSLGCMCSLWIVRMELS